MENKSENRVDDEKLGVRLRMGLKEGLSEIWKRGGIGVSKN